MNATNAEAQVNGRAQVGLLAVFVAVASIAVIAYAALHPDHETSALALAVLVAASAFDAVTGSIPLLLLLAAVTISGVSAALDHRIPWLVLAAAPIAYSAAKSGEAAIGWGDVLALVVLSIALPTNAATAAIIVGATTSLLFTLLSRQRGVRMTPFLALGGALALWFFVR